MNFSSKEIIKGLSKHGFVPVGGKRSHTTLRYETADTGEGRTVTAPQTDPVPMGHDTIMLIKRGVNDIRELYHWFDDSGVSGPEASRRTTRDGTILWFGRVDALHNSLKIVVVAAEQLVTVPRTT